MAPSQAVLFENAEQSLQSLIQTLYEISVNVYKYDTPPQSAEILIGQVTELVDRFQSVEQVADHMEGVLLSREIIEYVENGRNPDIYTREFAEAVVKQNQTLKGKQKALIDFQDVLAEQINVSFPELMDDVEKVLENTRGRSNPPNGERMLVNGTVPLPEVTMQGLTNGNRSAATAVSGNGEMKVLTNGNGGI